MSKEQDQGLVLSKENLLLAEWEFSCDLEHFLWSQLDPVLKNEDLLWDKLERIGKGIFDLEDLLWAKLRLALLKENVEYQEFFKKFRKHDKNKYAPWPAGAFDNFGLRGFRFFHGYPKYKEIRKIVDPSQDILDLKSSWVDVILPYLFYSPAVVNVEMKDQPLSVAYEGRGSMHVSTIEREGSKPFERFLKIDLRKKKKQILKEVENFLDGAYAQKKQAEVENDPYYYGSWKQDSTRYRKEVYQHLEVWKLCKQEISFKDIGIKLKISEDTAKKSFLRAHELTQGKKYDPQALRRKAGQVRKEEMSRTCATCPKRDTCTPDEMCPDVLKYIDQDILPYTREKLLKDNSDAHKDYLFQKNLP